MAGWMQSSHGVDDVSGGDRTPLWRISSVESTGEQGRPRLTSAAIHDTIQHLQGEQGRVQKKTFTKWINAYLAKHIPPGNIEDLFEDIKDGKNLLYLLETLSGEKLPIEKGMRLQRVHYLSNVSTALKFLQNRKIKLVNINAGDVVDGKPSIVLGLIWTIILYFQIEELLMTRRSRSSAQLNQDGSPAGGLQVSQDPRAAKQMMLGWAQQTVNTATSEYGVEVKDFGRSWRDGVAFNAMIDGLQPGLVDMDQVTQNLPRVNLENAFTTAEVHLGIPRLLDPEGKSGRSEEWKACH
jgi:nesprin-1